MKLRERRRKLNIVYLEQEDKNRYNIWQCAQ
jgi:hypothetical protein